MCIVTQYSSHTYEAKEEEGDILSNVGSGVNWKATVVTDHASIETVSRKTKRMSSS